MKASDIPTLSESLRMEAEHCFLAEGAQRGEWSLAMGLLGRKMLAAADQIDAVSDAPQLTDTDLMLMALNSLIHST